MSRTRYVKGRAATPVRAACPDCGKVRYLSRRDARRFAATAYQDRRMRAYQCGDFWHLSSAGASSTVHHRTAAGGTA